MSADDVKMLAAKIDDLKTRVAILERMGKRDMRIITVLVGLLVGIDKAPTIMQLIGG